MYMIWWNDVNDVISRGVILFACKVWVLRRGSNSMIISFESVEALIRALSRQMPVVYLAVAKLVVRIRLVWFFKVVNTTSEFP